MKAKINKHEIECVFEKGASTSSLNHKHRVK